MSGKVSITSNSAGLCAVSQTKLLPIVRALPCLVFAPPSHLFGLEQVIDVGPMSGKSNVLFWLEQRGISASDEIVDRIYRRAKGSDHTLSEAEIRECL